MSLIARMRLLAFAEPTLRAFFGNDFNTFRWFDTQLVQGKAPAQTALIFLGVSRMTTYLHNGRNPLRRDRVQLDVVDGNPEVSDAAAEAVCVWLDKANFVDNGALSSPVKTSMGPPANFLNNTRGGVYPFTDRALPTQTLDYFVWNIEPS